MPLILILSSWSNPHANAKYVPKFKKKCLYNKLSWPKYVGFVNRGDFYNLPWRLRSH